jgi:hypothetical protein
MRYFLALICVATWIAMGALPACSSEIIDPSAGSAGGSSVPCEPADSEECLPHTCEWCGSVFNTDGPLQPETCHGKGCPPGYSDNCCLPDENDGGKCCTCACPICQNDSSFVDCLCNACPACADYCGEADPFYKPYYPLVTLECQHCIQAVAGSTCKNDFEACCEYNLGSFGSLRITPDCCRVFPDGFGGACCGDKPCPP